MRFAFFLLRAAQQLGRIATAELTASPDPEGYQAAYPDCDRMLADLNADGVVNAFDIEPFIDLLFSP